MSKEEALLQLLGELGARGYKFIAVTPATHARVSCRPLRGPPTLRDVFGWNRPFHAAEIDASVLALLETANALEKADGRLRSKVRVSSLGARLFLHSSYPTEDRDSVFFGPDTYRFVRFVCDHLPGLRKSDWIVDMGAGTGAGGIVAAGSSAATRVTLIDVNAAALRFSAINAAYANVPVEIINADRMPANADLVIANPPYMMDEQRRAYRDGGELLGGEVALDWARQALSALAPAGTMLLYTGLAYENGEAPLIEALESVCCEASATLSIEELDPDVFGDELDRAAYSSVERIAAVGAVITRAA